MSDPNIGNEDFRSGNVSFRTIAELVDLGTRDLYQSTQIDLTVANVTPELFKPRFDVCWLWFERLDAYASTDFIIHFTEQQNDPIHVKPNDVYLFPWRRLWYEYTQQPVGSGRIVRMVLSGDPNWAKFVRQLG